MASGRKKNQSGFTMVEMIVSISIIAMISGLFLANYHNYRVNSELDVAAQSFATFMRGLQNNSLSLKEFNGTPTGWGAFFDRTNHKIEYFADLDANGWLQGAGETPSRREFKLPDGVLYNNIKLDGSACGGCNSVAVSFIPPDPTIKFCRQNANQCSYKSATVELIDRRGRKKYITINKIGLVDIQ